MLNIKIATTIPIGSVQLLGRTRNQVAIEREGLFVAFLFTFYKIFQFQVVAQGDMTWFLCVWE